ncbi:MAG: magnesium/cobalt transporter CorA [Phycisphaerales bacterium]|nr:magnesium/cobalt transporter CorA [Phycisphaerales bacterium]
MTRFTIDPLKPLRPLLGQPRRKLPRAGPRVGLPPGSIVVDPGHPTAVATAFGYGPDGFEERAITDVAQLDELRARWPLLWLNVDGLGDGSLIKAVGEKFSLHPLALEDVTDPNQRAKVEPYGDTTFIVIPMPRATAESFETEQLSIFMGKDFVVTFQERVGGDCLDPCRDRIRFKRGRVRTSGSAYLAYALLDNVIDSYFPALGTLGERLDGLEERIIFHTHADAIFEIRAVKRDLMRMRRAVWPVRDAVTTLMMLESVFDAEHRLYLRDAFDHVIRVMDLLDTDRAVASDLMEMYMAVSNNRLGEVTKVLTIIATIFIPLSFIASIYGMNFDPADSPWNMPELHWTYGYPFALGLMALVAGSFLLFFWRRGWLGGSFLGSNRRDPRED